MSNPPATLETVTTDVDFERHRIRGSRGWRGPLPSTIWRCFCLLHSNLGHVVGKEPFGQHMWANAISYTENRNRMAISDLRNWLRTTRWEVITWRGIGWELIEKDTEAE